MKLLELTLPSPQENLACDEALLEACEQSSAHEVLRFWEPREHFVVLGYSSRISSDVKLSACNRLGLPLFRRDSGGGTVLQGPGCLNFSLVLRMARHPKLASISGTTAWILERHRLALEPLLEQPVELAGQSDLAIGGLKFSGNAQRRKRRSLLFHGTFLVGLDLQLMERVLTNPPRQPAYRRQRPHERFVVNLSLPSHRIRQALAGAWRANRPAPALPRTHIGQLARSRYANPDWIRRFP